MKIFDESPFVNFKKDKNGHRVFYPWGVLGRGRTLPDELTETRIRKFLSNYLTTILLLNIFAILFLFTTGSKWLFPYLCMIILSEVLCYRFIINFLLADCAYSDEQLTLKEIYSYSASNAKNHILWINLITFALLPLGSIFIAFTASSANQILLGWFSVVFFCYSCASAGYLLKLKQNMIDSPPPWTE